MSSEITNRTAHKRPPREWARRLPSAARGRLAAGLLGVFLVFGLAGYAGTTAARHPRSHRAPPTFRLRVSPPHDTILAGSAAGFRIRLLRTHFPGIIKLTVVGGGPPGAIAMFSARRTRRWHSLLVIRTAARTPPRDYRLRIVATGGKLRRATVVTLTVGGRSQGNGATVAALPAFTLDGHVGAPLEPGIPQPVDVAITNPNTVPLSVIDLSVTVSALAAPQATGALSCTLADFAEQPYSGVNPVVVPPSSTRTLQELGVPVGEWPQLELIDLPRDQNGCQRASLTLAYSGRASLG
jgi:hypothetical protein